MGIVYVAVKKIGARCFAVCTSLPREGQNMGRTGRDRIVFNMTDYVESLQK